MPFWFRPGNWQSNRLVFFSADLALGQPLDGSDKACRGQASWHKESLLRDPQMQVPHLAGPTDAGPMDD